MFRIKRLYTFMLQRFLPVFAMTFFISLFVVLMVVIGVYSAPFVAFFSSVAGGMI